MIELLLQAERALSVGLLDRAETLYRQVARADPRNSMAVVGLARVTLDRGDEHGALDLARRALAIDPENDAAQRMVARLEEVIDYRVDAEAALAGVAVEAGAAAEPVVSTEPEVATEPEIPAEPEVPAEAEGPAEAVVPVQADVPAEADAAVEAEPPMQSEGTETTEPTVAAPAEVATEAAVATPPGQEPAIGSEPDAAPTTDRNRLRSFLDRLFRGR